MKPTVTYHDFVIKDGMFVGKFDEMYQQFNDPWTQSTQPNKYARAAGILNIQKSKARSVLECGCGLGYYAQWIYNETMIVPKSVDISPVAIERAKKLFPHLDFEVADISTRLTSFTQCEFILLSEIIWYILPNLAEINQTLKEYFSGKYLGVNQVFYKGTQKYGVEYFSNLKEFISYMPFKLISQCEATLVEDSTIETSTLFLIQ